MTRNEARLRELEGKIVAVCMLVPMRSGRLAGLIAQWATGDEIKRLEEKSEVND